MTEDGWRELVLDAVRRADAGDRELLDLVARLLAEQDDAKQALRAIGYGCIGMSWLAVVEAIRHGRSRG